MLFLLLTTTTGLTVLQEHVLPVFGCGTGCRVETEQLSLPERILDGWLRIKVRHRTWIARCDWNTSPLECVDEPASGRAGPPFQDLWLFANCPGERFATSKNPDRSDAPGTGCVLKRRGVRWIPEISDGSWKPLCEIGRSYARWKQGIKGCRTLDPEATAVLQRVL